MLKEYALQPELLASWPVCRDLSEKFGFSRGRVIARYPKRWERMVVDALDGCMPVERLRIVERLKILQRTALYPRHHAWDVEKPWLNNAIAEHAKRPFCAIISQDNPDAYETVICRADLDELEEPRWRPETQRHIERIASKMAACAEPLLRNAKRILFVDPYFNPQAPRFRRPLREFLQSVAKRPAGIPITCIEIHTGHTKAGTKSFFDEACAKHLPSIIPNGIKIRFVRWHQDHLHNRFILTEYGGAEILAGA